MKRKEEMTWWERLYIPEIVRGLLVTMSHFWRNLTLHILHALGFAKGTRAAYTVQYPEERKRYPDVYRGSHRLTLKEDGSVRCTSCFLCATACPANCIHIEAGEHPTPTWKNSRYAMKSIPYAAFTAGCASKPVRVTRSGWIPMCIRVFGVMTARILSNPKKFL